MNTTFVIEPCLPKRFITDYFPVTSSKTNCHKVFAHDGVEPIKKLFRV